MNLDKNIGWCTHTLNPTTGCLNKKLGICNQQEAKGKRPCPSCIEKYRIDPERRINYIGQDQERCRQCEPDYNPETSKFRHEQGNRVRSRLSRESYRVHHPGKKIVNGVWVYNKPDAIAKAGARV